MHIVNNDTTEPEVIAIVPFQLMAQGTKEAITDYEKKQKLCGIHVTGSMHILLFTFKWFCHCSVTVSFNRVYHIYRYTVMTA